METKIVTSSGMARTHSSQYATLCAALALFLISLATPSFASSYSDIDSESIYQSKDERYGHLEYVGFYASAMQHWNYTDALAPYTNLTWLAVYDADTIVERIRQAEAAGVKVVLSIQPHLFDQNFQRKPEYANELAELQQRLLYEGLVDNIAMIYPIDEPFLHADRSNHTSRGQMREDLASINHDIKALFPGIPIGVILNHREVSRSGLIIPASYDWIGMDCYQSLWDCDGKPMTALYTRMLERMTPEQMLMAVPETWVRYKDFERRDYESAAAYERRKKRMVSRLQKRLMHHYEIALSEPRFVAFIPFLWSMESAPGQPENPGFGVDQFAERFPDGGEGFVNSLLRISKQIKLGKQRYPNLSMEQTEPHLFRPANHYQGGILNIDNRGMVSAWSKNVALPHKNLRMQVVVYQDGAEIYASRLKRSFIQTSEHSEGWDWTWPSRLGIHGYRHRIPGFIRKQVSDQEVEVALRIYGDRAAKDTYLELRQAATF